MVVSEVIQSNTPLEGVQIELQYFPCLEYFGCLLRHDYSILDIDELYRKQTFRNRCMVLTANKVDTLSVPVKHYDSGTLSREIEIDYSQDWKRRHWGCLQSAYGKSPFYEYFAPEFKSVFDQDPQYLVDLNYELLTICLRLLGHKKEVRYKLSGPRIASDKLENLNSRINNKKSTKNYIYYQPVPYYQTFGNGFVENLSIVDLLFNMGPEARGILLQSTISK